MHAVAGSLDRIDFAALIVGGIVAVCVVVFFNGFDAGLVGFLTDGAFVGGVIAANHSIARRPRLRVEYRNTNVDGQPVTWPHHFNEERPQFHVVLINEGKGFARAFDVRFDSITAHVYNETGNLPDGRYLKTDVSPLRYMGGDQVLAPGDELPLARLVVHPSDHDPGTDLTANWTVRADNMPTITGTCHIQRLDRPPNA
jgi:hypothetical protein